MTGKTILIVEDNEDNALIYRLILERNEFQVLHARNGVEGVQVASEQHPDLILMDLALPLMDGWETMRQVRADPATAKIPIIALTAHAEAEDRARAWAVGCDGFLAKPCRVGRVLSEVERFLGRGQPVAA